MQSFFQHTEWYELTIETGQSFESATTANVYIKIICTTDSSPIFWLKDTTHVERKLFQAGSVVQFLISLSKNIGAPIGVHIWHDVTGKYPCWFLNSVRIRCIENNKVLVLPIHSWLSVIKGDKKPYLHIVNEGPNEAPQLLQCRINMGKKNGLALFEKFVANHHSWFGVFFSSPLSRFSKQERLACLLFHVLIILLVTSNLEFNDSKVAIIACLNNICIKDLHFFNGIISALIAFPPTVFISILFELTPTFSQSEEKKTGLTSSMKKGQRGSRRMIGRRRVKAKPAVRSLILASSGNEQDEIQSSDENGRPHSDVCRTQDKFLQQRKGVMRFNSPLRRSVKLELYNVKKSRRLSDIPEHNVSKPKYRYMINPEVPKNIIELNRNNSWLPKEMLYLEWTIMFFACTGCAYKSWLQSRKFNLRDITNWIVTIIIAILLDVMVLQLMRPLMQYLWLILKQRENKCFSLRDVVKSCHNRWYDIEQQWYNVHSHVNRMAYLDSINSKGISFPANLSRVRKDLKRNIARRRAFREFPLLFLLIAALVLVLNKERTSLDFLEKDFISNLLKTSREKFSSSLKSVSSKCWLIFVRIFSCISRQDIF